MLYHAVYVDKSGLILTHFVNWGENTIEFTGIAVYICTDFILCVSRTLWDLSFQCSVM